jgi:hypothetical protein
MPLTGKDCLDLCEVIEIVAGVVGGDVANRFNPALGEISRMR